MTDGILSIEIKLDNPYAPIICSLCYNGSSKGYVIDCDGYPEIRCVPHMYEDRNEYEKEQAELERETDH